MGNTIEMSQAQANLWKQLKVFEQRGDLQKQAEILVSALGSQLPPQAMPELLKMVRERVVAEQHKHPPALYRVNAETQSLQICNSLQGDVSKEIHFPKEAGFQPAAALNWSSLGAQVLQVLEVKGNRLHILQSYASLEPLQAGLLFNSSYTYLNLKAQQNLTSYFCRSLSHSLMPLESVRSLPYDLYASARHPHLAVADRGAGKVYLFQRDNLRLQRAWPIVPAPNKKALPLAFHPDGRRIFICAAQPGLLVMIDRGLAQKKIPLPTTHLLTGVMISNKGDLLYVLAVHPETRRPDLWVLDAQTYKHLHLIPLEGESFCAGADARDLFETTPDGQHAVLMVSRNQPALFTPCLLLIDLEAGNIVDQQLLKPEQKPVNLAFPARELVNPRFRLLPMLLHGGYGLTEERLKQIFGVEQLG